MTAALVRRMAPSLLVKCKPILLRPTCTTSVHRYNFLSKPRLHTLSRLKRRANASVESEPDYTPLDGKYLAGNQTCHGVLMLARAEVVVKPEVHFTSADVANGLRDMRAKHARMKNRCQKAEDERDAAIAEAAVAKAELNQFRIRPIIG